MTSKTKVTIYLPDELVKNLKKHVVDTGETLSDFSRAAIEMKIKDDKSRVGRRKLLARKKADEIDSIIKDLEKA